jgi:hypothetical protein
VSGEQTLAHYDWKELRFSISWKAYCFADEKERRAWAEHADDLTVDTVLERLLADLRRVSPSDAANPAGSAGRRARRGSVAGSVDSADAAILHRARSDARLVARGAADDPANRFERLFVEQDDSEPREPGEPGGAPPLRTVFYRDPSRTLLATNQSPDIPFDTSLNPYRGCEHGCAYCYARPTHEYLGFSAGLDFESRILVKQDAPELLRQALASPRWKPQVVALSGVTDPYQPAERRLRLTRRCLEVFLDFRNPVAIVTKNALVTRDADLLAALAGFGPPS